MIKALQISPTEDGMSLPSSSQPASPGCGHVLRHRRAPVCVARGAGSRLVARSKQTVAVLRGERCCSAAALGLQALDGGLRSPTCEELLRSPAVMLLAMCHLSRAPAADVTSGGKPTRSGWFEVSGTEQTCSLAQPLLSFQQSHLSTQPQQGQS